MHYPGLGRRFQGIFRNPTSSRPAALRQVQGQHVPTDTNAVAARGQGAEPLSCTWTTPGPSTRGVVREWVGARKAQGVECVLEFLPPDAPTLNRIERLRKFPRKEALQKWHATFADVQQAVAEVLDPLDRQAQQLASVMTERFCRRPRVKLVGVELG
jgi:hypothetical protein